MLVADLAYDLAELAGDDGLERALRPAYTLHGFG